MEKRESAYRGCFLGLAIGDAMGYTVDRKNWEEIKNDYGPNGLLGYDLTNGFADVSSYTQLAAFCANGLLAGITRGQLRGRMAPFIRYAEYAIAEWGKVQHIRRTPDTTFCWVCRVSQLRLRRCMDTRMLDTLSRGRYGSLEEPVNHFDSTGSITTARISEKTFHFAGHTEILYNYIRKNCPEIEPEARYFRVRSLTYSLFSIELALKEDRLKFAAEGRKFRAQLREHFGFIVKSPFFSKKDIGKR